MNRTWEITGAELDWLQRALDRPDVHTLRVAVDGDQVKFKINQGMWTLGVRPAQLPSMNNQQLQLEVREQPDTTGVFGTEHVVVWMTPEVDEDYWLFRVKLSDTQAIVGFPKFGTIGIGFAQEEDWNTNLPYSIDTEALFQHIAHNKGSDSISDDDVKAAIRLVQDAAQLYMKGPQP